MKFLNSPFKINLLLLICSFTMYFVHFHYIFLNLNAILSGVNGDTLKNYFTYLYNVKNDAHFLHFTGQNYPYGEHLIFTDCQPALTFILRLLPFTHDYLIGILHALVFGSFIITPLILNTIFLRLKLDSVVSFLLSLGITILSPQYFKLLAGHYALAYTCIVPWCILLLLKTFDLRSKKNLLLLFFFNLILFFVHPYLGFGTSLFCFTAILAYDLLNFSKELFLKRSFQNLLVNIVPLVVFRLFLSMTDTHVNRSPEPENVNVLLSGIGGLVLPNFGPFRDIMPKLFKVNPCNFEGFGYLGVVMIAITLLSILTLPLLRKKLVLSKDSLAVFMSSIVLLLLSFGLHNDLLAALHIRIAAIDQFRACGRFVWFFYYSLPLFLFPLLYHAFEIRFERKKALTAFRAVAVILLCFNLWESTYLFNQDKEAFWKFKNIFNEKYLSADEKQLIARIKKSHYQAIIPLPLYATGSDVYARPESGAMLYSMMYGYHCKLPVVGCFLTRTSATETEEVIQFLNAYKKEHAVMPLIKGRGDFLVFRSRDELMPDEERLYSKAQSIYKDSLMEALTLKENLLFKKVLDPTVLTFENQQNLTDGKNNIIYLRYEARKPFVETSLANYETIYTLDTNKLSAGTYVVSLHYHYKERTFSWIGCDLTVSRESKGKADWFYITQLKCFSGFYKDFAVFEKKIPLDKDTKYDFMSKGFSDKTYHISDFMLRPEGTSVVMMNGQDSILNNFPD